MLRGKTSEESMASRDRRKKGDDVGVVRGAAAVGAAFGLLIGMLLDQTSWGVLIGVAAGFVVGVIIDRQKQRK